MPQQLDRSVIRILDAQGKTRGTGFIIADGLAVTCAHVVALALGLEYARAGEAHNQLIQIQCYWNKEKGEARVDAGMWSPVERDDIAFLRFSTPLEGAVKLKLASAANCEGDSYTSLGFARQSEMYEARRADGKIKGLIEAKDKHQLLQIDGDLMYYGMSGAPILDTRLDRVVGMESAGLDDRFSRIAYAVTADTIAGFCPEARLGYRQDNAAGELAEKPKTKLQPIKILAIVIAAAFIVGIFALIRTYASFLLGPKAAVSSSATPGLTAAVTFTEPPRVVDAAYATQVPTATETPIPPTATPTPLTACSFTGATDFETISNLIEAEASASLAKDKVVIHAIFDRNADFYDYAVPDGEQPKFWPNPTSRYDDDLFINVTFENVNHFDIQQVGRSSDPDTAYFVSGSSWANSSDLTTPTFINGGKRTPPATPYGSDHWTLKKNDQGCWMITRFDFNAGHIPFPNP